VDEYPLNIKPRKITLYAEKINNLLGTELSQNEMVKILHRIELYVKENKILIPTFRPDLSHTADLSEEVARLYGFDNIAPKEAFKIDYRVSINELDTFIDHLNDILVGMGFQEVITNSMISSEVWEELIGEKPFPILNPISQDMDGLRNSLFPSLAEIINYNRNRKATDLKIFEINRAFFPRKNINSQPDEELQIVIAQVGKREGDLWYSSRQISDFYDIKGVVEALILKISLDNCQLISYSDDILEGDGLALKKGTEVIGFLGKLDRKIANYFEIDEDILVVQLSVEKLFKHAQIEKKYQPIPRYPSVERDLALIIDEGLEANSIIENIYQKGGDLLKNVEIFDFYKGKQIPTGKKSLAFHFTFQSMDRTLTEEEVNHLMEYIFASVHKSFQAKLRD
jgi:phenylalanyl-tRNA synthetase beta chain